MEDLFKPTGNTPFELAEARMASGIAQVKAASALQELITTVNECDILINEWRTQLLDGSVEDDTRDLAAQALRDKRACNKAIDSLVNLMTKQFNFEA